MYMLFFQSTGKSSWPNGKTTSYAQTIDERFCLFTAIMSDLPRDRLLPAAVKWPRICDETPPTKWHLIPGQPNKHDNILGDKLAYASKWEALMARYFGQNLLSATGALTGYLEDGAVSVPVPAGSSQGLRHKFTTAARKATKEKL